MKGEVTDRQRLMMDKWESNNVIQNLIVEIRLHFPESDRRRYGRVLLALTNWYVFCRFWWNEEVVSPGARFDSQR